MGKSSTKFKIGEPLIYRAWGSFTNPEMVIVMDHQGDYQGKFKKIPILWQSKALKGAWYMCPIRHLRRPTQKELIAWQLEQY